MDEKLFLTNLREELFQLSLGYIKTIQYAAEVSVFIESFYATTCEVFYALAS